MMGYATETNPQYRLIRSELSSLRQELNRLRGESEEEGDGGSAGQSPFVALGLAPDALLAHHQTKREVDYWENIVMLIGRFGELGKIDESRDMSLFQVLDWATPPHDKSKPRTRVNAILAGIGTGFLCLFWVLVCAYVEQRQAQSAQFEQQWRELVSTLANAAPFFTSRSRAR
jgi:hypothetical protein